MVGLCLGKNLCVSGKEAIMKEYGRKPYNSSVKYEKILRIEEIFNILIWP